MQGSSVRFQTFTIRPPRNPVLRALAAIAGIIITAGIFIVGLIVGTAVLVGAAVMLLARRWLNRGRGSRPRPDNDIIEGEYTVVPRARAGLPRPD